MKLNKKPSPDLMKSFSQRSFVTFILILLFVSRSLAFSDEIVDRKSLSVLTKDWKYAAIYSLSSDGNIKLLTNLKGNKPNMEIPMGKLEYTQHFGKSNNHNQDLLFVFIVLSEAKSEGQEGLLQTRIRSMKIISFGEKEEVMKSKLFSLSLLIGKSSNPLEKKVFTVPQLIESMAPGADSGTP